MCNPTTSQRHIGKGSNVKRVTAITTAVVLSCASAYCATFSHNQGGATGSSSVIDANGDGDYTTLAEAANDFSNYSGAVAGDYTFFVNSDTYETTTIAFAAPTNGYHVRLRPMGAPRKITLEVPTTSNQGGRIYVGAHYVAGKYTLVRTDSFEILGSLGAGSRDLVFSNVHTTGTTGVRPIVQFTAGSKDCKLRDCSFENDNRMQDGFATLPPIGVAVASGIYVTPYSCDNFSVENCKFGSAESPLSEGIRALGLNPVTYGWRATGNEIYALFYGLNVQGTPDGLLQHNQITMVGAPTISPSETVAGICTRTVTPDTPQTHRIDSNAIRLTAYPWLQGGYYAAPHAGVMVKDSAMGGKLRIECTNNMLSILAAPGRSAAMYAQMYGIWQDTSSYVGRSEISLVHNTIDIGTRDAAATDQPGCVGVDIYSGTTCTLINNLVSVGLSTGGCVSPWAGLSKYDGNCWFCAGDSMTAGYQKTSFTQWQLAGNDLHGQWFNARPFFASADDLHLASVPPGMKPGVSVTDPVVPVDIDGEQRNPYAPYPGSDELPLSLEPVDVGIALTASASQFVVGDSITCHVTVSNENRSTATVVTWRIRVPLGLEVVSATNGEQPRGVQQQATGEIAQLGPFSSESADVVLRALKPGTYATTATVASVDCDPEQSNNTAACSFAVNERPVLSDIVVSQTCDTTAPEAGEPIRFTVLVRNVGPSAASDIVVTDTLPLNLLSSSLTATRGWVGVSDGPAEWHIPVLAAGEGAMLLVSGTTGDPGTYTNVAEAAAAQTDPDLTNNRAEASVEVVEAKITSGPDLTGRWLQLKQNVHRGKGRRAAAAATLTGKLQVANEGDLPSGAFGVAYYLSSDQQFDTSDKPLGTQPWNALPPGKNATKSFRAQAPASEASGKYIIAVLDPGDAINETDEAANIAVYGPLK